MGEAFTRDDLDRWFDQHYPKVKHTTIQSHVTAATVNNKSRTHYNMKVGDLLFRRDDGKLVRYDPSKHGWWRNGLPKLSAPPTPPPQAEGRGSDPTAAEDPAGPVRGVIEASWGMELPGRVLPLEGGVTQRFDFVSQDEKTVGLLIDREALPRTERWKAIGEALWLLERHGAPTCFLAFTGDPSLPKMWLEHLGRAAANIDFVFITADRVEDLRED